MPQDFDDGLSGVLNILGRALAATCSYLYARAGIAEAWLVDLATDVIEVHRQPGLEGYREVHTLRRGDTLSALLLPASAIPVDDVL